LRWWLFVWFIGDRGLGDLAIVDRYCTGVIERKSEFTNLAAVAAVAAMSLQSEC
jgi:hypothetical protein